MFSSSFLINVFWKARHKFATFLLYPPFWRYRRTISKLNLQNKADNALYNALLNYRRPQLQDEELKVINKIEGTRNKLYADNTILERIDYGTGIKDKLKAAEGQKSLIKVKKLARGSSKTPKELLLLFYLIKEFKPLKCLEMGTCFGLSAGYQALALASNKSGVLISIEGAPVVASMAEKHIRDWGLDVFAQVECGSFAQMLVPALNKLEHLNYVFIDGHHDGQATLGYLETIIPFLEDNALLVFDDINRSAGMWAAWETVMNRDCISLTISIGGIGLAIFSKSATSKKRIIA